LPIEKDRKGVTSSMQPSSPVPDERRPVRIPRPMILTALLLLLAQAAAIKTLSGSLSAVLLSDSIQLALGILCTLVCVRAIRTANVIERNYWICLAASYVVWSAPEILEIYIEITGKEYLNPLDDFLFFASVMPFGMMLLLESHPSCEGFDCLHVVDFLQVLAFWGSVYLYFAKVELIYLTAVGLGPFGWTPDLLFKCMLMLSFVARAALTNERAARMFFATWGAFLLSSGLSDSYASLSSNHIEGGHWFDMLWSSLTVTPVVVLAARDWTRSDREAAQPEAQRVLVNQLFPLVYPFFGILLLFQVPSSERAASSWMGAIIFVVVGVRVLLIQHRLVNAQNRLEFEANHDALTGLRNRRAVLECLERELSRQRRNGHSIGLIMTDLDHFKSINDRYGHAVGDQVLAEIARRLMSSLRDYDSAGRYGGEEFLIIVPDCNAQQTLSSAERLREIVGNSAVGSGAGPIKVTVSIGLISTHGSAQQLDATMLLRLADEALYRAKARGRNRVECAYWWAEESKPAPGGLNPVAQPST
jgi:diguanylate cyclase (GGDEF)-like protein